MTDRRAFARRNVLRGIGLATAGSLAGCSSSSDGTTDTTDPSTPADGTEPSRTATTATRDDEPVSVESGTISSGDLPPYADLLPSLDTDHTLFTAFGTETESGHEVGAVPEDPSDPLRFDGLAGAVTGRVLAAFLLSTTFGFRVDRLGIDRTKRVLSVGGVGVQVLPVDLAGARGDLEDSDVDVRVRAEDRIVFVGPEDDVFGLTGDALVFASADQRSGPFDPVDRIRAIVNTRTGTRRPKHETDDAFASLLRHAEPGGSVAGAYAPGSDLSTLVAERASGGAPSSVDLVTDGFGRASAGLFRMGLRNGDAPQPASGTLVYPTREAIDEDALTSTVGTAATDRSYVRDGTTVRVRGSYSWAALSAFERDGAFS